MQKSRSKWGVGFVVGLGLLLSVLSSAEAVIKIDTAEVQDGVAHIEGNGAVPGAQIFWEGGLVTRANTNNGGFKFVGVLPDDCTGTLSDGSATVSVTVLGCKPVSAGAPAPVEVTGQTTCFDSSGDETPCTDTGQDGALQAGVPFTTPRFTDNLNGTVTDNLTGLIWLKNANCLGEQTWENALNAAKSLADGQCGLWDGSVAGDWRLPNVKELQSLIHFGFFAPALFNAAGTGQWTEGDAFSGVQSASYWSSTTLAGNPALAWLVLLHDGNTFASGKDFTFPVWLVRGGA